jgi:superfamily II DNA/RNA helicase
MQLKKINPLLQQALIENELTEANEMQLETFTTIKSGVDAVIQSPKGTGKSTTIVLNVLQRIEKQVGESTRALVFVQDKEHVLEMVPMIKEILITIKIKYHLEWTLLLEPQPKSTLCLLLQDLT